jgi:hypothetical protein
MAGQAGGSARREYERRRERDHDRRRARLRITIPIVTLAFPVTFILVHVAVNMINNAVHNIPATTTSSQTASPSKPAVDAGTTNLLALLFATGATATLAKEAWGRRQTTEAWRVGAEGEERTARQLDRLERDGYRILHDGRMPGRQSNIDHIVIGPTGVLTIETKNYGGKVRLSRRFLDRETVAMHNGRRLDGVVDQARAQAEVVARIVHDAVPEREVRVQPVVAVQRAQVEYGWFVRPTTRGVRWCSARQLVRVIKRNATSLRGPEIAAIGAALERALLPTMSPKLTSTPESPSAAATESPPPTCRCGAPMVMRHRRRDGAAFYGCSTFPACRHTQLS